MQDGLSLSKAPPGGQLLATRGEEPLLEETSVYLANKFTVLSVSWTSCQESSHQTT